MGETTADADPVTDLMNVLPQEYQSTLAYWEPKWTACFKATNGVYQAYTQGCYGKDVYDEYMHRLIKGTRSSVTRPTLESTLFWAYFERSGAVGVLARCSECGADGKCHLEIDEAHDLMERDAVDEEWQCLDCSD